MVGRVDEHEIRFAFREGFSIVVVRLGAVVRFLAFGDHAGRVLARFPVNVANSDHFDRSDLNEPEKVHFAVPARANEQHAVRFAAGVRGIVGKRRGRESCG